MVAGVILPAVAIIKERCEIGLVAAVVHLRGRKEKKKTGEERGRNKRTHRERCIRSGGSWTDEL